MTIVNNHIDTREHNKHMLIYFCYPFSNTNKNITCTYYCIKLNCCTLQIENPDRKLILVHKLKKKKTRF